MWAHLLGYRHIGPILLAACMEGLDMARVLVVDDSDNAAMTMALLLKHCGHEAAVAESGKAALQYAPAFHPDVVFIDLTMPEVDGLDVARQLRQTPEFAELPLVAVSGYVDAEHRAQATAAGFNEFLAKPYGLDALQATMERIAARIGVRPVSVSIAKSGISNVVTMSERPDADELRQWLKVERCRVGPVFEPADGRFGFFVYSQRQTIGERIAKHGGFIVNQTTRFWS